MVLQVSRSESWRRDDSPLNVFLYVEPFEVRVEVIARPLDIQEWTDVGVEGLKTIPVEIQPRSAEGCRFSCLSLDLDHRWRGRRPALDRVDFLERTLETSTVVTPPRELMPARPPGKVIFVQPMKDIRKRRR